MERTFRRDHVIDTVSTKYKLVMKSMLSISDSNRHILLDVWCLKRNLRVSGRGQSFPIPVT